jgi:hypothetical protein
VELLWVSPHSTPAPITPITPIPASTPSFTPGSKHLKISGKISYRKGRPSGPNCLGGWGQLQRKLSSQHQANKPRLTSPPVQGGLTFQRSHPKTQLQEWENSNVNSSTCWPGQGIIVCVSVCLSVNFITYPQIICPQFFYLQLIANTRPPSCAAWIIAVVSSSVSPPPHLPMNLQDVSQTPPSLCSKPSQYFAFIWFQIIIKRYSETLGEILICIRL